MTVLIRCRGDQPCREVLARLLAADRLRDLDVDPELAQSVARQLRDRAEQFARIHREEEAARR